MADTLQNLAIPANIWVDLYSTYSIPVGTRITVRNVGTCDVYLAVSATQPPVTHDKYDILRRNGPELTNNAGDSGVWAFCPSEAGKVNVSVRQENGFVPLQAPSSVAITDPTNRTAMVSMTGESHVGFKTDYISVNFQYSISGRDTIGGGASTGTGSVAHVGSMATVSPGLGVGRAEVTSRDSVRHRAGHECFGAMSAVMAPPEAGLDQFVGFLDEDNGWAFGYRGLTFGLWFVTGGVYTFIPQSAFNQDKLDGAGSSGYDINPQTGQVYRLTYGWHGFLNLQAEVRTDTGAWAPVHRQVFVNAAVSPHLGNPDLPLAVRIERVAGAGSDAALSTGSWRGGIISGPPTDTTADRWFSVTQLDFPLVNGRNNVFTLRNKQTYSGKTNHVLVEIAITDIVNDANKTFAVYGVYDATLVGAGAYTDVNTADSVLEVATGGTITGGERGPATVLRAGNEVTIDSRGTGVKIHPGQTLTFEVDPGDVINGTASISTRFIEYH